MRHLLSILVILLIGTSHQGCKYDIEEELYGPVDCDLSDVTFSQNIEPLIVTHCFPCHSEVEQFGNISLEGYDAIVEQAENGNLLGSVRHDPGYEAMPEGEAKLPDCDIAAIEAWIENGTPNN